MKVDELRPERHRARHKILHEAVDELLADYLVHHPHSVPSRISLLELLKWSNEQQENPTTFDEEKKT